MPDFPLFSATTALINVDMQRCFGEGNGAPDPGPVQGEPARLSHYQESGTAPQPLGVRPTPDEVWRSNGRRERCHVHQEEQDRVVR